MSIARNIKIEKFMLCCGVSLAAFAAAPAAAQTVCVPGVGGLNCAPTNDGDPVDLPGQTEPVTVDLPEGFATDDTILVDSTGPVTIDSDATVATVGDDQPALDLTSDADIFAQVDTLSTEGDDSTGALLQAGDDAILIVDDGVTTLGDNSDGINVTAGSAEVTAGEVRTAGVESDGVEIVTVSGPGTLDADLIETLGDGSTGAILRSAGDIGVNVGVLRTEGDQALGLDLQSDPATCAVLGAGSCDVEAVAGNITTDGFGSTGALVVAAGDTSIDVDTLQTGGDEAAGLDLSADPAACVAVGVGGCDTAFTVQNLATDGARSPGAVVRGAGDIDGSVGVLTTNGEDSAGLDLASDPDACVILGAGGCETSFSVGQLTTNGDGSTGALVRAAGPTSASIGALDTFGDDATGVDIAADPAACVLLGLGGCDTAVTADRITTRGDGSGGALIAAPADIFADFGTVETFGADAPAIAIESDPEACVLLGAGACDTTLTADRVSTEGDNSAGVLVNTPGRIVADIGLVETNGDGSPAVSLATDPAACLLLGDGACGVTADIGEVNTAGADSNGIEVATGDGDQAITAGPVAVSGLGSSGLVAAASGCADVSVVVTGPVSAPNGVGIDAQSGCTVTVATRAGAPVSGGEAGIRATSGTGTTIFVGDALSSADGPALDADGAAAAVTIGASGSITGRIDLTDNNDTLTNNGTLFATRSSDFGAGTDAFVNNGQIVAANGAVSLAGLETLSNTGLIDLRDGAADDVLTLPGAYSGGGAAALGVDVIAGTGSDRLVVGGAATGSTDLLVDGLDGGFVPGAVVVDAGAGTSAGAFAFDPVTVGFTDYSLAFDAAANDFLVFGTPNQDAVGAVLLGQGARAIFYRGNEAVGSHLAALGSGGDGASASEQSRIGRALWLQGFGMVQNRDTTLDTTVFGQPRSYDLDSRQDWFGGQVGYDLPVGTTSVLGVTGGYISSRLKLRNGPLRLDYDAWNVGAYGRADFGAFFLNGLVKYEHYSVDYGFATTGPSAETEGDGWGGWLEAGARFGGARIALEPMVSIEYANIDLDPFTIAGTGFDLGEEDGLRGKAGLRITGLVSEGPTRVSAYGSAQAIHEFGGDDRLVLTNSGQSPSFVNPRPDTYGRATLGISAATGARVRGFVEGSIDFAGNVSGGGARGGVSVIF